MLLALDVGNTQTVIGLFNSVSPDSTHSDSDLSDPARFELLFHWRLSTVAERTADEHVLMLTQLLALKGLDAFTAIDGIVLSSTVPIVQAALREMRERWFQVPCVVLGPGVRTGMPILYDNPKEVGPDRIANAVAALELYGGPAIVVDFGTATTFDALSADGEYLGGAIAPGIQVSLDALVEKAAALRRVELLEPKNIIGRSTVESIQSGTLFGYAGLVQGLCERFAQVLGNASVIATGGMGELLLRFCPSIQHYEPWLTLYGLKIIYTKNSFE